MSAAVLAVVLTVPVEPEVKVDGLFTKVAPNPKTPGRSKDQSRAVVLIHGLGLYPLNTEKVSKADLRTWQRTDSGIVTELAKHADVYALAYGQTVAVEKVHEKVKLAEHIKALKTEGYQEIILVGHSAGGLIARYFVEDHPELGVTKVIQVCCPNGGSPFAALKTAREAQRAFVASLSRTARSTFRENRKQVLIPVGIEFVCIVGTLRLGTDGIVTSRAQWTEDLQKQGVPALLLRTAHWDAMKSTKGAAFICKIVCEKQPRWKEEQVNEAKKKLLGD